MKDAAPSPARIEVPMKYSATAFMPKLSRSRLKRAPKLERFVGKVTLSVFIYCPRLFVPLDLPYAFPNRQWGNYEFNIRLTNRRTLGLTDFLVGVNSKKTGVLWSLLFSHLVAFVVLSSLVLTVWPFHFDPAYADTYLKAFISAVLMSIGALLLCLAFKWGKISIIGPLVATYGCFTAFFSWAGGDVLSQAEYLGIGVCAVGVVFVLSPEERKPPAQGLQPFQYCLPSVQHVSGTEFLDSGRIRSAYSRTRTNAAVE